jgi:hypothetical protein
MKLLSIILLSLVSVQSWSSCFFNTNIDIAFDSNLNSQIENYIDSQMESKNYSKSNLPGVMTLSIYSDCNDSFCFAMGGWGMAVSTRSGRHMANPESLVWGVVGEVITKIPACF